MIDWYIKDIQSGFYPAREAQRWTPIFKSGGKIVKSPPKHSKVIIGLHDSKKHKNVWLTLVDGTPQKPQTYSAKLENDWLEWLKESRHDRTIWYEVKDEDSKLDGTVQPGITGQVKTAPIMGEWQTVDGKLNFVLHKKGPFWQNHMVEILSQKASVNVIHKYRKRTLVLTPEDTHGRTIAKALQNILLDVKSTDTVFATVKGRIDTRDGKVECAPFSVSGEGDEIKWLIAQELAKGFWANGGTYTEVADLVEFANENANMDVSPWIGLSPENESKDGALHIEIILHEGEEEYTEAI